MERVHIPVRRRLVRASIPAAVVILRVRLVRDARHGELAVVERVLSHARPASIGMAVHVHRVKQVITVQDSAARRKVP